MLKCQQDSYVTKFTTKLVECIKDNFMVSTAPGVLGIVEGTGFVLEDTIFFPEGGGQPCDQGVISIMRGETPDSIQLGVTNVFRKDGKVIHLLEETSFPLKDLPPGTTVHESVNWDRRLYHMTQHSGQHLISALADIMFSMKTLSWCLGPDCSYVELGAETVTDVQFKKLESEVNSYIHKDLPVTVNFYKEDDPELKNAKTRGLPEGHMGDVRVVVIEGLDRNMCCGTHVSSLKQLQVIKFLKTKKKISKSKKTCLLYFVVGEERVFQMFDDMQKREDAISLCLNKTPPEHVQVIQEMKDSLRNTLKKLKKLQQENVLAQANAFKEIDPLPPLFSFHRPDGDIDLLKFVTSQFKDMNNVMLFLTVGEGNEGHMWLVGPKEVVAQLGPEVCSCLEGKGQLNRNWYQAKVSQLSKRKKAEELVKQKLESSNITI